MAKAATPPKAFSEMAALLAVLVAVSTSVEVTVEALVTVEAMVAVEVPVTVAVEVAVPVMVEEPLALALTFFFPPLASARATTANKAKRAKTWKKRI